MGTAPRGTVTFLFTDIEGSTHLWEQYPEAMRRALVAHDRVLRDAIERRSGYVFSTGGDGLAAAFWTTRDAVDAALDAQRRLAEEQWPDGVTIRVRMGLHTGSAVERDGDYFGSAVNRAARVMAAGHGGQILLSLVSEELVRDQLPDGSRLADLGEHRLAGVARPLRIFQLTGTGLDDEFPPLRTAGALAGNLPTHLARFVGRATEVQQLDQLVRDHRVVCITGAGGMGKTRTSLAVAANLLADFPDGVWLAELAPVSQPDAVDAVVMAALGQPPVPGMPARQVVVDALSPRRSLLLVDNCEHVADTAADLITAVVHHCPDVHVLATSRQALGVEGEWTYPLQPLSGDDQIELFRDRAAAAGADAAGANSAGLGALCARLDGMPLAIELAAARLRSMSLAELVQRLDQRLQLLSVRTGDPRHRTLEAVVDWSFSQLDDTTRRFFCTLSVFAGGFTSEAAAAVTDQDELTTLDLLDQLVDRSLIEASPDARWTSYRLLETLRHYARDHMDEEEQAAAIDRHGEFYATEIGRCMHQLRQGNDDAAVTGVTACWDNVREAVHHALASRNADQALQLVTPLSAYMYLRPDPEVAEWASIALALPEGADHRLALWAHIMLAQIGYSRLDLDGAERHARHALQIVTDHRLRPLARAHLALAYALSFQGRLDEAIATVGQAIDLAVEQGSTMDLIEGLHNRVCFHLWAGMLPRPGDLEELARLHAEADNPRAKAVAAGGLGLARLVSGSTEAAESLAEAGRLTTAAGLDIISGLYRCIARIATGAGAPERTLTGVVEVLECYRQSRLPVVLRGNLRLFAPSFAALGRDRVVAIIQGGGTPTTIFPQQTEVAIEVARQKLGPDAFQAAVAEGRAMTDEELAGFLRSELDELGITA